MKKRPENNVRKNRPLFTYWKIEKPFTGSDLFLWFSDEQFGVTEKTFNSLATPMA